MVFLKPKLSKVHKFMLVLQVLEQRILFCTCTAFDFCTVEQYRRCLRKALHDARQNADFCTCGTPCLEALYVSSLSFASITTTEDSIKSRQDAESFLMEKNLAHAREMAFRYKAEKYKETMRVFHITETEVICIYNIFMSLNT